MRDKATGRSRGFAFVTFKDGESLDRALQSPHHQLDGRQIEAKRAIPKAEIASKTKKIFVGGVPHTVNDDQFREFFSRFGEITEALIMRDRATNKSRGFGFVTFVHEDSVDKVFAAGQLQIQGKHVEVKKAEPKRPSTATPASAAATPPIAVAAHFPGAPAGSTAFPVFYAAPFPYPAHAFASPYAGAPQAQPGLPEDPASFMLSATSPPAAFFSFPSGHSPQGLLPGAALVGFGNAFAAAPSQAGAGALASGSIGPGAVPVMQNASRTSRIVSMAPLSSGSSLLLDPQPRVAHAQAPGHLTVAGQPKSLAQQPPASNAMGLVRTYPAPIGQPPRSLSPTIVGALGPAAPSQRYPSPGLGLVQVFADAEAEEDYMQPSYAAVRHTI